MTTAYELRRRAKAMRREPTEAERRLWSLLRAKRLEHLKFKRQEPLGPYIADFVCFGLRLVVEADGSQHAENAYDARRDAWFEANGFQVLRFWNNDILANPEGVADRILREVPARPKRLTSPSPWRSLRERLSLPREGGGSLTTPSGRSRTARRRTRPWRSVRSGVRRS